MVDPLNNPNWRLELLQQYNQTPEERQQAAQQEVVQALEDAYGWTPYYGENNQIVYEPEPETGPVVEEQPYLDWINTGTVSSDAELERNQANNIMSFLFNRPQITEERKQASLPALPSDPVSGLNLQGFTPEETAREEAIYNSTFADSNQEEPTTGFERLLSNIAPSQMVRDDYYEKPEFEALDDNALSALSESVDNGVETEQEYEDRLRDSAAGFWDYLPLVEQRSKREDSSPDWQRLYDVTMGNRPEQAQLENQPLPNIEGGNLNLNMPDIKLPTGLGVSGFDTVSPNLEIINPELGTAEAASALPSISGGDVTPESVASAVGNVARDASVDGFSYDQAGMERLLESQNQPTAPESEEQAFARELDSARNLFAEQPPAQPQERWREYEYMPQVEVPLNIVDPGLGTVESDEGAEKNQARATLDALNGTSDFLFAASPSSDEVNKIYEDERKNMGVEDNDWTPGSDEAMRGLGRIISAISGNMEDEEARNSQENAFRQLSHGTDQAANENIDDGSMTQWALDSKYMTPEAALKYKEMGLGGRPDEELIRAMQNGQVLNKLDEMRDYGFKPYIRDARTAAKWNATQAADNVTKLYNQFHQLRDINTRTPINFKGQRIDRDDLLSAPYQDYMDANKDAFNSENWLAVNDPNVNPDEHTPLSIIWNVSMSDGSNYSFPVTEAPKITNKADGTVLLSLTTKDGPVQILFDDANDFNNNASATYEPTDDPESIAAYAPTSRFNYKQSDGQDVSLSYADYIELMNSVANNTADVDYGWLNLGKDVNDRKNWAEMAATMDWSDLAPNAVDLFTGSAPLFFNQTAWPMAAANAVTATQGLDPRQYNWRDNTYTRLAPDISGDQYILNTILSGTVPATERIAGVVGGGKGIVGTPIQDILRERGVHPALRHALDIIGEGVEEDVAAGWEDLQTYGWNNQFANQINDEDYNVLENEDGTYDIMDKNGNVIYDDLDDDIMHYRGKYYDSTGHELRDLTTDLGGRFINYMGQVPENTIAGTFLGGVMDLPRMAYERATNSGYYAEAAAERALRDFERTHGLPRYFFSRQNQNDAYRDYNFTPLTEEDFERR